MQVSVITPVHNAADFLVQAVESALAQPQTGQVILVEDGSTDSSLAMCRSLAERHDRVQVLQHPGGANYGVSASRNLGIAAARCEYTSFLDADDWYLPGRFEPAAREFASDSTVDGVYDAVGTVYEDQQVAEWCRNSREPELISLCERFEPEALFEALVADDNGFFCTDGIVVRTRLFERTGLFDTSLRMGEDTAMWIRMAALGRLVAGSLTEPVGMRRIHARNTIYSNRQQNPRYAVQMARLLVRWARTVRLPWRRRVLLLNLLLNFRMTEEFQTDVSYLRRKARELAFFGGFALRHPLIVRSSHYWSVLGATVGTRRLFPKRAVAAHAVSGMQ